MKELVNIIISAIELNDELLKCLREINKINYSNFFVTIILDRDLKNKLPKFRYKINKLIVGEINMSKKRNEAAKKFNSDFLAFIDSDACPSKNWLTNAIKEIKSKKIEIIGGPNIPFENQNFWQKKSFFQ